MHILISNDDGVHAKGLYHLVQAIMSIHGVTVIAPDRDLSGASNSLTLTRPLRVMPQDNGFYGVDGTPADCVHLGINGALDIKPDMVVSGINHGANLGDDVLYSGTVAAAMEGRYLPHHAMAVSLVGDKHFDTAAEVVKRLMAGMEQLELPERCIINVNVPDIPYADIKGVQLTTLGKRNLGQAAIDAHDPRGHRCFWIGKVGDVADASEGTDFHAIANGYVSVTPLAPDMANREAFAPLEPWLQEFF
jgi:5'-nucleotidase